MYRVLLYITLQSRAKELHNRYCSTTLAPVAIRRRNVLKSETGLGAEDTARLPVDMYILHTHTHTVLPLARLSPFTF